MVCRVTWIIAMVLACSAAVAQERTAGDALDAQTAWKALATHTEALNTRIDGSGTKLALFEACGAKGMIYAPGRPGGDSQDCVAAALPASVITTINAAQNTINTTINTTNNVVKCGSAGMIYDKSSNACITVVKPGMVAQTVKSASSMKGGGKYASYALSTCPAGTILVGCSGARNASITDTCDEEDCGLVGYGPINATTCRVTVDTDRGTNPTVWTTCLKTK